MEAADTSQRAGQTVFGRDRAVGLGANAVERVSKISLDRPSRDDHFDVERG